MNFSISMHNTDCFHLFVRSCSLVTAVPFFFFFLKKEFWVTATCLFADLFCLLFVWYVYLFEPDFTLSIDNKKHGTQSVKVDMCIQHRAAQTAWECEMCTGGSVIHTAHYPNERHSHHILSRTKLCDHWSSASSGFQFKTCQSRSSLTPSIQTLVTETSFHWLAPKMSPNDFGL